jgi:hypothetical protein
VLARAKSAGKEIVLCHFVDQFFSDRQALNGVCAISLA